MVSSDTCYHVNDLGGYYVAGSQQSQKDRYCGIPLPRGPWQSQVQRDRKEGSGSLGLEERAGESVFHGDRGSGLQDEQSSRVDDGMATRQWECT